MTKSGDVPPPAYSASSSEKHHGHGHDADDGPPPNYIPLTRFTIGKCASVDAVVSIAEIKGHLGLLHAFAELKKQVESLEVDVPHLAEDKEKKWTWFVGLAVERFDMWCRSLKLEEARKPWQVVLPPIDVLMVWHSYMLNPRWCAEDCMRIPQCQTLRAFEPHFKQLLQDTSDILTGAPSKERFAFWVWNTQNAGFDPIAAALFITKKSLKCPRCDADNEVDFVNQDGTGYFQQKFKTPCINPACPGVGITKEALALRKLAEDLAERDGSALPGTLFTASPLDISKGKKIKEKIYDEGKLASVHHTQQNKRGLVDPIMKYCSHSLVKLKGQMGAKDQPALVDRIMSAYHDEKAYSVELVGAILRQGSFVKKMYDLGWTSPGFFDDYADELALHHAMARYHAFLDLMSSSPASFFVPTLDIDLVWHTHQLMPEKYSADCTEYLQRFIDHDDKVETMQLSSAFDITCQAWKERFGVQYTHCGCAIPGNTIGQRLSRMVGIHSRAPANSSHLVPFDRPDLLAATHASEHNSVHFVSTNLRLNRLLMLRNEVARRRKLKEQEAADKKAAKQTTSRRLSSVIGALLMPKAPRQPLNSTRPEKRVEGGYEEERYGHSAPFLIPVPILFGGAGVGGCVSSDGHTVSSVGACASVGTIMHHGHASGSGGCGGSGSGGCGGGGSSGGAGCGGGSGGGDGGGGSGGGCGGGGGGGGCGGGGGGCGGGGGGGGCGGC